MAHDNAKLVNVLDQRIRAVLEETLRGSFAHELRNLVRTEMLGAFGVDAVKNTVVRKAAKQGRRAAAPAAKGAATATCNVAGCANPHRSRGYCSAHYQAARKYEWPMPAPAGFEPPDRERARRA